MPGFGGGWILHRRVNFYCILVAFNIKISEGEMKCPVCGAAELVHDTRDVPYTYKGESTRIPAVSGKFCPACAEIVLSMDEADKYSDAVGELHKQVNATFVVSL